MIGPDQNVTANRKWNNHDPAPLWSGMMRLSSLILMLVWLGGCSSLPKHMTGQFNAQRGDAIVIEKDGSVYWSPSAKPSDRRDLIGIASTDKNDRERVRVAVPSTSPFIFSSFRFSTDHSRLSVDWGSLAAEVAQRRSTEFERVSPR